MSFTICRTLHGTTLSRCVGIKSLVCYNWNDKFTFWHINRAEKVWCIDFEVVANPGTLDRERGGQQFVSNIGKKNSAFNSGNSTNRSEIYKRYVCDGLSYTLSEEVVNGNIWITLQSLFSFLFDVQGEIILVLFKYKYQETINSIK